MPESLRRKWSLTQLQHAMTLIGVAKSLGLPARGQAVGLTVGAGESQFRNLASKKVPASLQFPHDAVAEGDHRSVGVMQAQVGMDWGSLAQLMDPVHQFRAFYGGPNKPIDADRGKPTPPGLLDIPFWEVMSIARAAHRVQGNLDPDYYTQWEDDAWELLAALGDVAPADLAQAACTPPPVAAGGWASPLPPPLAWAPTFGMRVHPKTGELRHHDGQDWGRPLGTPVHAVGAGRVVWAAAISGYGLTVDLELSDGTVLRYGHLSRIDVIQGVAAASGQTLGAVGTTGLSTGPHLHFEVRPTGGRWGDPIDPLPWLRQRGLI